MKFEWDPEKARRNIQNHQVDFEEASTIFEDLQFITVLDKEHSINEEKFYRTAR